MPALIYLVDDEPLLLELLSQYLAKASTDWQVKTFMRPGLAIEAVREKQPDIVISDFGMPEMTGAALLEQIRQDAPHTIRILVSGYANPKAMGNKISAAHQYLAKPFSLADIRSKVQKALNALVRFKNTEIRGTVLSIRTLPAMPSIYYELIGALEDPDSSYTDLVEILAKDAAISAKVLQMANSPLFREGGVPVIDLLQAITILGTERIKAVVLSHQLLGNYTSIPEYFYPANLSQHRWDTANTAYKMATRMDLTEDQISDAYVAGLMHDMGRLVLLDNFSTIYREACLRALSEKRPISLVENDVFKMNQSDVIGFLVSLWGMRDRISNTIVYQDRPWEAPDEDTRLTASAVYLAHLRSNKSRKSEKFEQLPANTDYLEQRGLMPLLGDEKK